MAKFSVSRIFEASRWSATEAGAQLTGALTYLAEFVETTARCLKQGLTYSDNFSCEEKTVRLRANFDTVLVGSASSRRVSEVRVRQANDQTYFEVASFGWRYDSRGRVVARVSFKKDPPEGREIALAILIFYG